MLLYCFLLCRLSTYGPNNLTTPLITRSFSDNKIKITSPNMESSLTDIPKYTNKLISEKSPYLLQHAHNPVDWYPWGEEAFEKAKREDKLIFLSVGYSTCHWCHVMEKESFESEEIAKVMNEHFVNIKVDREERPDIDRIYMLFIMATTRSGGWPMSVFLTPELHPVTGGTYFPPNNRHGLPGFKTVLLSVARKWKEDRSNCLKACNNIMEVLEQLSLMDTPEISNNIPTEATWERCVQRYMSIFEPEFGGFGLAPKFPQSSILNFLFHYYARDKTHPESNKCLDMCLLTLTKIANGGIHDHIAGGFARYSVDGHWHVPHFEKMLYDQAQLTVVYTDAFLATKDEFYADVVRDIIKYVKRDLRHESGGFYSAEDADSYPTFNSSVKKEGAFYVWEYDELKSILSDKKINSISYLDIFCEYFSVEENGNISPGSDPHGEIAHKNVLIIYGTKEECARKFGLSVEQFNQVIEECLQILYDARQKRPRPHLDTKILCSWNGLMLAGLAQAGQGLGEKVYVEDAIKTANFIKEHLYDATTNTLFHSCYRSNDGIIVQPYV